MKLLLGLATWAAVAQVPLQDIRNTYTPDQDTHFAMPHYASRRNWDLHRVHLRNQILSAAGLLPVPERLPVRAHAMWRATLSGVTVETILLETLPGFFVGANVYLPLRNPGRAPAVLVPHGHWKRGRLEHQASYSVPALCINLAKQGYLALTWDMVGYNDTRQTPHNFGGWREQLWSFSPMGLQLWNSIRAVDYLETRRDVDSRRIAVTGASGGGTQTFLLAAVDRRVRVSVPVNMVSAHMQGGDPCEEAPSLRLGSSNVEFAAMMAPRPMLIVSATGDWTRNTPREEFPFVQRIYELYERAGRVANAHIDAGHNYNRQSREAVYAFLAPYLLSGGPAPEVIDRDIDPFKDDDLLALRHGALPANAPDYDRLFAQWMYRSREQTSRAPARALRRALGYALGVVWPLAISSATEGDRLVLSRTGRGDRVSGIWIPGRKPAALVVDPEGAAMGHHRSPVADMIRNGRLVYLIDVFQTGASMARRNRAGDWFLSYNQTDDANRVQDILTALAFVKKQAGAMPELVGIKQASVWCLFAAAVAPEKVDLNIDLNSFEGSDQNFHDQFFVPGIQRAGGLRAALRLAGDDTGPR